MEIGGNLTLYTPGKKFANWEKTRVKIHFRSANCAEMEMRKEGKKEVNTPFFNHSPIVRRSRNELF
jgi:hypothetical protein